MSFTHIKEMAVRHEKDDVSTGGRSGVQQGLGQSGRSAVLRALGSISPDVVAKALSEDSPSGRALAAAFGLSTETAQEAVKATYGAPTTDKQ